MNNQTLTPYIKLSEAVQTALAQRKPILALESTVITHGLPYPQNMEIALELEQLAKEQNVIPATIAIIDGVIHVGLDTQCMAKLAELTQVESRHNVLKKIALRDIPLAVAKQWSGGTTVSATMFLAYQAGIEVFATGGIGGVHRGWQESMDISADLQALASYPVIVVTAGCKAILDIPATLEQLESLSVPVYGWQADFCPAFYTQTTAYPIDRVDDIQTIRAAYRAATSFPKQSNASGLVIMNPIPAEFNIPSEQIEPVIEQAVREAVQLGIKGKAITPWLLKRLSEITDGKSVTANLALLKNNVLLGCKIAKELAKSM
jgi:pseudouridine-5'-phosphate glycosidase